jgi:hypothetical protein
LLGWFSLKIALLQNLISEYRNVSDFCRSTAYLKKAKNDENPIPKFARFEPSDIAEAFRFSPCNAVGTTASQKG